MRHHPSHHIHQITTLLSHNFIIYVVCFITTAITVLILSLLMHCKHYFHNLRLLLRRNKHLEKDSWGKKKKSFHLQHCEPQHLHGPRAQSLSPNCRYVGKTSCNVDVCSSFHDQEMGTSWMMKMCLNLLHFHLAACQGHVHLQIPEMMKKKKKAI